MTDMDKMMIDDAAWLMRWFGNGDKCTPDMRARLKRIVVRLADAPTEPARRAETGNTDSVAKP